MKFHDELNPQLWNGLELKPDVKEKLKEIAEAFKEYLDIPEDAILDIRITGSSASYNYTEYSDLDLHLIIDYEKVHEDCPLVEGYLWSYKSQFNSNHDISIYGVPVELYAEDSKQEAISNSVYSLMEDRWLKEPKKIPPTDNDEDVQAKYQELKDAIDKCDDSEVANELLDKIYKMRKSGLAEVGEFSTENMAFKLLRNDGSIDKLKKLKKEKVDKQLSLESYNEEMYIDEKDVPPLHDYAIIFKYQEPWPDGKLAYRAIMKLTTGSSYRMQSWSYTKEGMINIVKKKWPYADIVDKTNEPVSESYNEEDVEKLETLEDLKNYFDTGLETIDCEITYFPYEPTQKVLRITSASSKINREWLKEVSNGKIKLVGVRQHKNRFGGWIKMYDHFYGYVDNKNESIRNTGKFNVGDKVRKGKKIATIKKVDSPEKGYLDVEFEDEKDNGSYPKQYFRKITESKDMITTINKLIDNVNKTMKTASKNPKEVNLYKLEQETNEDGEVLLTLYKGNKKFMTAKLVGNTLLGDDIVGHLKSVKSFKYNEGKKNLRYGFTNIQEALSTNMLKELVQKYPYHTVGTIKKMAEELEDLTDVGCVLEIRESNSWHSCYTILKKKDINKWKHTYICDGKLIEAQTRMVTTYDVAENITSEDNRVNSVTIKQETSESTNNKNIQYPKNREELINKYNGVFEIDDNILEISNLYNKEKDNYSGGFGKSYNVNGRVFNKFENAIKYMKKLSENSKKSIKETTMLLNKLNKVINEALDYDEEHLLKILKDMDTKVFKLKPFWVDVHDLLDMINDVYPLPYTSHEFVNTLTKLGVNLYTIDQSDINEFIENNEEALQDAGKLEEVQELNGFTYYGDADAETVISQIFDI